jgi:hypothetical protein
LQLSHPHAIIVGAEPASACMKKPDTDVKWHDTKLETGTDEDFV